VRVERYTAEHREEWNDFVRSSKNGTFLFEREYMEYHSERFVDWSLIVRDRRGRAIALLPASREEGTLISHGGLTYGGFVSGGRMTTTRMLDVFGACLDQISEEGMEGVVYKCVPHIYHSQPAEEDAYALFINDAQLFRRDVSSAIDTRRPLAFRQGREGVLRRARRAGLSVARVDGFEEFWPVLEANLRERHDTKPVHTLDEITYLARCFPENILLFQCAGAGETLAGVVVYVSAQVCHIQYTGVTAEGRRQGALDLVLAEVIERFSATHGVIDFGISTERNGRYLNRGLADFKEGFGARAVNYDTYQLRVPRRD
jgi:hypothetical protein